MELTGILDLYIPCFFTNMFKFLNPMISIIMCGHLSREEFDAATLANSIIFVFGLNIDMGFSTAFDTLFAQIYGSGQKKKMGSLLQRAIIIITLLFLLLACLHLNIQPILIALRQDPLISRLATRYLSIYLPGLFFEFQFLALSRYLQNQNIVLPMMVSAGLANVFNIVSQYIAIFIFEQRLESSAFLQATSVFIMFLLQLGYVVISGCYKDTWDGFSLKEAFSNWSVIFALGVPGTFMTGIELCNFELITFVAGSLSALQLGAQSVAMQCAVFAFLMSSGLGAAVTVRVGQYLGSRDIGRLKSCFKTITIIGILVVVMNFSVILSLRSEIAKLFSIDKDIRQEAANLLIIIAIIQPFDVMLVITAGILKASGRQCIGLYIMAASYYVVGIPLGFMLVFLVGLDIKGMWIGLELALVIEEIIYFIIICRTNWDTECDKALHNTMYFENVHHNEEDSTESERKDNLISSWTTDKGKEAFKKTVIKRLVTIFVILLIFLGSLLLRIYLPESLYMPCMHPINGTILHYLKYDHL